MAQGQIIQAAAPQGLPGDGPVGAVRLRISVEQADLQQFALCLRQAVMALRRRKAAAPDPTPQLRQVHSLRGTPENMHILRPGRQRPGRPVVIPVVVARGHKDPPPEPAKGLLQGRRRLRTDPLPIEHISGQQQQVTAALIGQGDDLPRQPPLQGPPFRRQLRRQAGKRRIQMQVRRVKDSNHGFAPLSTIYK